MTRREIEKELLKATLIYLEMEEKYNEEDGDDACEHMLIENEMYNAKEKMDELFKMLKEAK